MFIFNGKNVKVLSIKCTETANSTNENAKGGFHAGTLTRSNWNMEVLIVVERGKPENPEKNPRSKHVN